MTVLITTISEYNFPLPYLNMIDLSKRKTPFLFYYGKYCGVNVETNHVSFISAYPGSAEEILDIVRSTVYMDVIFSLDSKKIIYDLKTHTLLCDVGFQYSPANTPSTESILALDGDNNLYKMYNTAQIQVCAYAHNLANRMETYKATELGKTIFLEMISMIYKMPLCNPDYVADKFEPKTTGIYSIPKENLVTLDKLVAKLDERLKKKEDEKYKRAKPEDLVDHGMMLLSDFISLDEVPSMSSTVHLDDDLLILPKGTDVYFAGKKFWIKYREPTPPLSLLEYKELLHLDATIQVNLVRDIGRQFVFGEGYSEYTEGD